MKKLILTIAIVTQCSITWADQIAPGIYRTPDSRFANLKDYPFKANYLQIGKYRVHYLDEGPTDADPILLMHGEPSWSYLYRKMIPILTTAGHRVIAPDLVGFGKSDKPALESDYSYAMQVDIMVKLVQQLQLKSTTLFCQDWGGLIGLRVVAAEPGRFARVVASNTGLPSAEGIPGRIGYSLFKAAVWWLGSLTMQELKTELTFTRWVAYSHNVDDLPVGELMTFMGVDKSAAEAYEAPFPDRRYKSGVHVMPYLVPSQLRENAAAWQILDQSNIPFMVAFGDSDPITKGGDQEFLDRIKNTKKATIKDAGHFIQEDAGPELAELIIKFIDDSQPSSD